MLALVALGAIGWPWAAVQGEGPRGIYVAPGAAPQPWSVNEHHALIWGGKPYLPVGVNIPGSVEFVNAAKAAGVLDAIVELPASGTGWKPVIEALESAGMRYILAVDSLAPGAHGVIVEPQGYRVSGITKPRTVELRLPGASSAFVVLVTRHDGDVRKTARVQTPDGRFVYEVVPPNDLEHVLLIYPTAKSWSVVDCWEGFDAHRDALLRALQTCPPGPGLRGILNPVGETLRLRPDRGFVPSSSLFRFELQDYLRNRYRSVETVMRAWSMSMSDIESFEQLSRLVPLWSGSRGVPRLLDPITDKTYVCDPQRSSIWADIEIVLNSAMARRFSRLARAVRQVCDVPILQDWSDWAAPYESGAASLDGIGARTSGATLASLSETAGRAASTVLRRRTPAWFLASRIDLSGIADAPAQVTGTCDDLAAIGCRAWFVRSPDKDMLAAIASEAARRSGDASLAQWSPRGIFFPESASNPAHTMRLPGGAWWLPAPLDGNRVELGESFVAYRLEDGDNSFFALWTTGGSKRVKLRIVDVKSAGFSTVDGSDPKPKAVRGGVEVDVSELPLLITGIQEIPVPEPAIQEAVALFDQLLAAAASRQMDTTENVFLFRDALSGMERAPGGGFAGLMAQVQRLSEKLGAHTWIEAERVAETNFSEVVPVPGVSGGNVLSLRTSLAGPDTYVAEYVFHPRTEQELEVWVAAKIPAEHKQQVRIALGGHEARLSSEPIGRYSLGYGWYKVGPARFKPGETRIAVKVLPGEGADLALDAILLAPQGFVPNGLKRPSALNAMRR